MELSGALGTRSTSWPESARPARRPCPPAMLSTPPAASSMEQHGGHGGAARGLDPGGYPDQRHVGLLHRLAEGRHRDRRRKHGDGPADSVARIARPTTMASMPGPGITIMTTPASRTTEPTVKTPTRQVV